jgi:hypothetical protein
MLITITFRDQTEHKRSGYERGNADLSRGEAEPLPQFVEFETPALFHHKRK